MAKSKLEGYWSQDNLGRNCLVLKKSKGRINQLEVYEWMESHNMSGCSYIHMADCPSDEVPADLYEDEDKWFLYEPEEILGEIASRASANTGYQYIITKR